MHLHTNTAHAREGAHERAPIITLDTSHGGVYKRACVDANDLGCSFFDSRQIAFAEERRSRKRARLSAAVTPVILRVTCHGNETGHTSPPANRVSGQVVDSHSGLYTAGVVPHSVPGLSIPC